MKIIRSSSFLISRILITLVLPINLILVNLSCDSGDQGRKLAFKNCSSCHLFPEPSLLTKTIWKQDVLPEMGFFLGHGGMDEFLKRKGQLDFYEEATFQQFYPEKPLISGEEWQLIQEYYLKNAPDTLNSIKEITMTEDLNNFFEFETYSMDQSPCATFVSFDEKHKEFYMANQDSEVRVYAQDFKPLKTFKATSPVSYLERDDNGIFTLLMMGRMNPNNLPLGSLIRTPLADKLSIRNELANGLNRPVHFQKGDFNKDGITDYLICNFGYYIGRLSWYEGLKNGNFREHVLNPISGSIKTIVRDLNKDGYDDFLVLMAQGNEGVYLFSNLKNGEFSQKSFVRVPPVYGSSDFALADFDGDGSDDIAIACGDNGDFSKILKPYHGIHIFSNDGQWNFKEKAFLPMHGSTGLRVSDFDKDGDMDIASIAYFSDFKRIPDRGFAMFENKGKMQFEGHISAKTDVGRWLVINNADINGDKGNDVILGSCITTLRDLVPDKLKDWSERKVNYLILKNKTKAKK